ncbi:MAG: hypothetical protein WBQ10_16200 [Terriglobales bacterium]|jgi:hypothetical protein
MEHIDKHNSIEAGFGEWQAHSVKGLYRQPDLVSNQNVDSLDLKVRTFIEKQS